MSELESWSAPRRLPSGKIWPSRRARAHALIALLMLIPAAALSTRVALANEPGLFEKLFSFGSASASRSMPQRQTPMSTPASASRAPVTEIPYDGPKSSPATDASHASHGSSTQYRTLCVRSCDGYFFPISDKATRRQFYRDTELCHSRCGEDAKLFYYPLSDGEPSSMVDLQGHVYSKLAVAFNYRKQLVPGCRCHADPWDSSEAARHLGYAMEQQSERARAKLEAEQKAVSDAEPSKSTPSKPDKLIASVASTPTTAPAVSPSVYGPPMSASIADLNLIAKGSPTSTVIATPPPARVAAAASPAKPQSAKRPADEKPVAKARNEKPSRHASDKQPVKSGNRIFVSDNKGGWIEVRRPPHGARLLSERPTASASTRTRKSQSSPRLSHDGSTTAPHRMG